MENPSQSYSENFDKVMKDCMGYEECINNEDKYFSETLNLCEQVVKDIQKESIFSPNEEIADIDPHNLKYLLLPYYQAETMFRLMDDRKKRIQVSKQFYDEFLKLMNHYELVSDDAKRVWKASIHPEEVRSQPKLSAMEDREQKIKELKQKKILQATIDKLKDSEDLKDVKEFWLSMIDLSIYKATAAFKSIDLEFQLLAYRDSLPEEARRPSEPPSGPKKAIQMFHIPQGALDGESYMFGDQNAATAAAAQSQASGDSGVVKSYNETGERVTVNTDSMNLQDRLNIQDKYKAQVFQPCWNQPTMSLDEFAQNEMADAMAREQAQAASMAAEEAKDPEQREEEERVKQAKWDDYCDDVPKGYGNTKRL